MEDKKEDLSLKRFRGRPHWLNPKNPLVSSVNTEKLYKTEVSLIKYSKFENWKDTLGDEEWRASGKKFSDSYENIKKHLSKEKVQLVDFDSGTDRLPVITTNEGLYGFDDWNASPKENHELFLLDWYLNHNGIGLINSVEFYYFRHNSFFIEMRNKIVLEHFIFPDNFFKNDAERFLILDPRNERLDARAGPYRYMYKKFYEETETGRIQSLEPESYNFLEERFWIDPDYYADVKKLKESDVSHKLSSIEDKITELINTIKGYVSILKTLFFICTFAYFGGLIFDKIKSFFGW